MNTHPGIKKSLSGSIGIPVSGLQLTKEEKEMLSGKRGATMQRIMRTIVAHGEVLGAERLVEITGIGHLVISHAIPGISPSMEMLDDLMAAGLKTRRPFTVDPAASLDFENWDLDPVQIEILKRIYRAQKQYDKKLLKLGLQGPDAYTCTPYLPEVGAIPRRGDILAWSESACVVFANSVLGARTNRNGAIMDLFTSQREKRYARTPAIPIFMGWIWQIKSFASRGQPAPRRAALSGAAWPNSASLPWPCCFPFK